MSHNKRALILLAPGFEELEAITLSDLLTRADIDVTTASLDDAPVTASRGTTIIANTCIDTVENSLFDILILPGGLPGANYLRDDERVQNIIKHHADKQRYVAAICAAPKALAQAGILHNKTVTCFPGALNDSNLQTTHISHAAIEVDGNILTSRGPGTAMDFALLLIEKLLGQEKRDQINAQLVRD